MSHKDTDIQPDTVEEQRIVSTLPQKDVSAQPQKDVATPILPTVSDNGTKVLETEIKSAMSSSKKRGAKRVQLNDIPVTTSKVIKTIKPPAEESSSKVLAGNQSKVSEFHTQDVSSSTQLNNVPDKPSKLSCSVSEKTKTTLKRFLFQEKEQTSNSKTPSAHISSRIVGLSSLNDITDKDLELD